MLTRTLLGHLALTALLAVALNACATDDSAARPVAPPERATVATVSGNTLAFEGFELAFKPAQVQVARPGRYVVTFTNTGHAEHDWSAGGVRLVARPGETMRGEVEVPASGLEFVCSIPGHVPAGMRGSITVAAAADRLP